jgi:hypothetical protein
VARIFFACIATLLSLLGATPTGAQPRTSCVACHSNPDLFDADAIAAVVENFANDVHGILGASDPQSSV